MEDTVKKEIRRIKKILVNYGVPADKIGIMMPVIENTAFIKGKLDETKALIEKSSVVISYDNGGGQKGIRENPIFKGYENLWKSYISGMQRILDMLPDDKKEVKKVELEKPKNMLEIVRARKQA